MHLCMHHISLLYLVQFGVSSPMKFTVVYDHCNSLLPTEICISCNMGKRDLPDMYAQKPEGHRPEG